MKESKATAKYELVFSFFFNFFDLHYVAVLNKFPKSTHTIIFILCSAPAATSSHAPLITYTKIVQEIVQLATRMAEEEQEYLRDKTRKMLHSNAWAELVELCSRTSNSSTRTEKRMRWGRLKLDTVHFICSINVLFAVGGGGEEMLQFPSRVFAVGLKTCYIIINISFYLWWLQWWRTRDDANWFGTHKRMTNFMDKWLWVLVITREVRYLQLHWRNLI